MQPAIGTWVVLVTEPDAIELQQGQRGELVSLAALAIASPAPHCFLTVNTGVIVEAGVHPCVHFLAGEG